MFRHTDQWTSGSEPDEELVMQAQGIYPLPVEDILREIDAALERRGISARAASIRAQGAPEMIRDMRRGHIPSVERLRSLCEVLGLEFYVGPPRWRRAEDGGALPDIPLRALERAAQDLVRMTVDAGGNPFPQDQFPAPAGEHLTLDPTRLAVLASGKRSFLDTATDTAGRHTSALRDPSEDPFASEVNFGSSSHSYGRVVEVPGIADHDALNREEQDREYREWLEMRGIDPDKYTVVLLEKLWTKPAPPKEGEAISGSGKTDSSPLSKNVATLKSDTPSGPAVTDAD